VKWIRVILIAGVVVVGGTVAAVSAINTWLFGQGEIHVLAGEDTVTVQMDGLDLGQVEGMAVGRFHVDQGEHDLVITDAEGQVQEVTVDVGGWTEVVVTSAGRCMADLDVTDGIYNSSEADWTVKDWHGAGGVADMPSNGGTSFVDLPEEIDQYDRARLLVSVPCEMQGETEAINQIAALRMVLETQGAEGLTE